MKPAELLLFLLAAWTLLGVIGISLRLLRHDHRTALRHSLWIAAIWTLYLVLLLSLSFAQPARIVALGADQCFDEMCFAVTGVQQIPGFPTLDSSHLLQIQIRITNRGHGHPESEHLLRVYLRDAQGHSYNPVPGLSGNLLTAPVAAGDSIVSQPVFRLPSNTSPLQLVFTHGKRQPGLLVLGDPDSLFHKPTVVPLNP